MCLIIKGTASLISDEILKDAYNFNQDGWGIMYADHQRLKVIRGFTLSNLLTGFALVPAQTEVFVHLRMRTHGDVNKANLHPYRITNDLYVMHNGVVNNVERPYSSWSDTKAVVALITPLLKSNPLLVFTPGFNKLFQAIAKGSRFVFLHSSGRYSIFNQQEGINYRGLWCSNTYAWSLWEKETPHVKLKGLSLRQSEYHSWQDPSVSAHPCALLDLEDPEPLFDGDYIDIDYLRSLDKDSILDILESDPWIVIDAIKYC
jgi:hypothetical protein